MAFISWQSSGAPADLRTDLSDERRLAQLRRIEELKTQIGHIPWPNQKQQNLQDRERTSPISSVSSPGGNPSRSIQTSTANDQVSSHLHNYGSDQDIDMPDWIDSPAVQHDNANGPENARQAQDQFHGDHTDSSDGVAGSQRTGSAMSKRSANSSNTSAEVSDIKIKQEERDQNLFETPSVAKFSESALLSPLQSNAPLLTSTSVNGTPSKRRKVTNERKSLFNTFRAKTSIPPDIPHEELARQSCEAALASRLNPFVLHHDEYQLLRHHICHAHVSAYLNIRNRILRLWVRSPLVTVTPEEAAGCAYSAKWLGLAEVAYEWLVRRGYINFGCLHVPDLSDFKLKRYRRKSGRKTIVVVGAGMAGLGCARQLDGLFNHYREAWSAEGEEPPQVVLLEGRARVGGRIYSHQLQSQNAKGIPKRLRCTAETGAHIITGFNHGNPLNMIIRGQLALSYHSITDNDYLYDVDGKIVNGDRDRLVEKLFNDILERSSLYRHSATPPDTVKGDQNLIEDGKDPSAETGKLISKVEEESNTVLNKPVTLSDKGLVQIPAGFDKLTGKANLITSSRERQPSSKALREMGWSLPSGTALKELDLDTLVDITKYPTLGSTIDSAIEHYQKLLNLTPQDFRLLNWHIANLEYANAANLGKLSLGGWDQDGGNEFQGEHCQVMGGYSQVPRGIMERPTLLDVRNQRTVSRIEYDASSAAEQVAKVYCESGEIFDAEHVVLTTPLGVLKDQAIAFEPPLPDWKRESIERLGFGLLNKVILVYEKPFWNVDEDMIGLLRDTDQPGSSEQSDYAPNRGRFYLFWNTIKTSGRPVLITMMAGDAAFQAERLTDGEIIAEVTEQLASMYRHKTVPLPSEAIVTRWGQDKFARGTYSNVGPEARSEDYDAMAKRVGNLHFAGEATCGTHPATVHGAYISGLRAAAEIIEDYLGPIQVPKPLVPIIIKLDAKPGPSPTHNAPVKVEKKEELPIGETEQEKMARLDAFEGDIIKAILQKLGPRPDKPGKQGANPFLLYSKDKWIECKAKCDEARRAASGNPEAKASRNDIRAALGLMWREASDEVKKPYLDRTVVNRASNQDNVSSFHAKLSEWDSEAMSIRREYVNSHPGVLSQEEEKNMWQALGVFAGIGRKAKKMSGYADASEDDMVGK